MNKRSLQCDVKQQTLPSVGRDANYVPGEHETEESELRCLLMQPLYFFALVSDDIQTPQGVTCILPYSKEHMIRKYLSADAKMATIARWVNSNRLS
jgi:hypothetical protein